jgi:hypothetical protein
MAVPIGPKLQVAELVMIAERHGYVFKKSPHLFVVADDGSYLQVQYLYHPKTGARFNLTGYDPDDYILGDEIKNASRRLGIPLP